MARWMRSCWERADGNVIENDTTTRESYSLDHSHVMYSRVISNPELLCSAERNGQFAWGL